MTGGGIDLEVGLAHARYAGSVRLAAGLTERTELLQAAVETRVPRLVRGARGLGAGDALPRGRVGFLAEGALGSAEGEGGEGDEEEMDSVHVGRGGQAASVLFTPVGVDSELDLKSVQR